MGVVLVGLTMVGMIIWMDHRQRQRGVRVKPGGPEPSPASGDNDGSTREERSNDDSRDASQEDRSRGVMNHAPEASR